MSHGGRDFEYRHPVLDVLHLHAFVRGKLAQDDAGDVCAQDGTCPGGQ